MSAITVIVSELNKVFSALDARVVEQAKVWSDGRVAALAEFKASDEHKALRGNEWARYEKLFAIAGGKTWYRVFNDYNKEQRHSFMEKNCAAIAAKRNVRIAAKCEKAGVTSIVSQSFTSTSDGFNGVFIVDTSKGQHRITIDTIYAGGYNIQCAHLRVLCNVKKI